MSMEEKSYKIFEDEDHTSYVEDGWHIDKWRSSGTLLKIDKKMYEEKTPFQTITVLYSKHHGNILLLDGIVQATQCDGFVYNEMMAHIPLNCHPNPEKVLIIGGTEGGVLSEVVKHKRVKSILHCDIDERLSEMARVYFPQLAASFDDPRVQIIIEDGNLIVKKYENEFDVIIQDSAHMLGPNAPDSMVEFYENMHKCLKDGGIICCQGEALTQEAECIIEVMDAMRKVFPVVSYANFIVPTYEGGHIGQYLASKNKDTDFAAPTRDNDEDVAHELKYYSSSVHTSAVRLPRFAQDMLYGHLGQVTK